MPPVSLLIKPASGLCNLRCRYCFYEDEARNRAQASYGLMSAATLENVLARAFAEAEGGVNIAFQGGEPTLAGLDFFHQVVALEQRLNARKVRVVNSIQTNGYRLGEDWARFFAENDFLVGLSLDGVRHTHDAYRLRADGSGTFFDILETKNLFDRCGVKYNILTVVNARTAQNARKIYEFYRKNGLKYLQFIPCLDPIDGAPQPFSLSAEAYGRFLAELFDLWFADWEKGCQPYIRAFENYVGIMLGYPPESCDQVGRCSLQNVVEANGDVYPCDFYVLDEYRLGNLNEDSLADIRARLPQTAFLEQSLEVPPECSRCDFYFICRAGCRRHRRRRADGTLENRFCAAYRAFFAHALPRLHYLANALTQGARGPRRAP